MKGDDLVKKGWVKVNMWFEVLAAKKDVAKKTLKEHIAKIKRMEGVRIAKEKYEKVEEVKDVPPKFKMKGITKAYSQIAEVLMFVDSVEKLLFIIMVFGPSGIEILEPKEFHLDLATMQIIMNSVADMMHRFAASGAGGVVITLGEK